MYRSFRSATWGLTSYHLSALTIQGGYEMVANYGVTHKCGQTVKSVNASEIVTGISLPKPWMFGADRESPPTPTRPLPIPNGGRPARKEDNSNLKMSTRLVFCWFWSQDHYACAYYNVFREFSSFSLIFLLLLRMSRHTKRMMVRLVFPEKPDEGV